MALLSRAAKQRVLARISFSAARFNPDFQNSFLCPTCLSQLSLALQDQITLAHIVPKSAGGTLTTFLCGKCNSKFGSNQDFWFGEYLYLLRSGKCLLGTRKQDKNFWINSVRAAGKIEQSAEGIDVYVHYDRMSPNNIAALKRASDAATLEITASLPLLRHEWQISVGFLTAAYLLWFSELGYSWVFQSHLDTIRRQISNPSERIASENFFIVEANEEFKYPWIGFLEVGNDAYPASGIADRVVILPSFSSPHVFLDLAHLRGKRATFDLEKVKLSRHHQFPEPVGLIYRDQVMTLPDFYLSPRTRLKVFRYAGDGGRPEILHQMDHLAGATKEGAHVVKMRSQRNRGI